MRLHFSLLSISLSMSMEMIMWMPRKLPENGDCTALLLLELRVGLTPPPYLPYQGGHVQAHLLYSPPRLPFSLCHGSVDQPLWGSVAPAWPPTWHMLLPSHLHPHVSTGALWRKGGVKDICWYAEINYLISWSKNSRENLYFLLHTFRTTNLDRSLKVSCLSKIYYIIGRMKYYIKRDATHPHM